ncbi:MAG: hydroxymethylbilane synthase [Bacillota bacterium]|nr:hydroxymethylbilane synthase [Bacillota bacterium]
MKIRVGTRGSRLALSQAASVRQALLALVPDDVEVALVPIVTRGDRRQDVSLARLRGRGVFVKEVEQALLDGRVQMAVHSAKDLTSLLPQGLRLAAFPPRQDPRDALLTPLGRPAATLSSLPRGARVATGSIRRQAQLRHLRPDLELVDLRGNVETRLRRLDAGEFDALVLAVAGLARLGVAGRAWTLLEPGEMLPAVGQGALAVEIRDEPGPVAEWAERLNDPETALCVTVEREFLAAFGGGCEVPLAALARLSPDGATVTLAARALDPGGTRMLETRCSAPREAPEGLGRRAAEELIARGALELVGRHAGRR